MHAARSSVLVLRPRYRGFPGLVALLYRCLIAS